MILTRADPAFQPARVQIAEATVGGQPAARTSTYGYTQGNGVRVAEAEYAVVIPTTAVYLFAAIAPQEDFNAHVSDFQAIIDSI